MKINGITTGLLAAVLISNIAVKKVPEEHNRNSSLEKEQRTNISQIINFASEGLTAKIAMADNENYGERDYANAMAFWRDGNIYDAMELMEKVLDNHPLDMRYAKTLIGFYKDTELYGEAAEFFAPFIESNKEEINKNQKKSKFYAKALYEAGIDSIYETAPKEARSDKRSIIKKDYESGIKLLESAVQLQPNNTDYNYELGWGYDIAAQFYQPDKKEFGKLMVDAINAQIKSIDLGGAKFVKSKRERKFVIDMCSPAFKMYEKAAKLDPEFKYWEEKSNDIKEHIQNNF